MNEWSTLPNKLILDANSISKFIGKYVTKIVYDQVFNVGVVGNLLSTRRILSKYGDAQAKKIFGVQRGIFSYPCESYS